MIPVGRELQIYSLKRQNTIHRRKENTQQQKILVTKKKKKKKRKEKKRKKDIKLHERCNAALQCK